MSAPSYDVATLAGSFAPMQPELFADRIVGPALRQLAETDPDLIAAVAEVDRSQIRACFARSPLQRLNIASSLARSYARFRRVGG